MTETYPVLPGQEGFTLEGRASDAHPERRRVAIGVIHGFTGNPSSVRPLAEGLADRGFPIEAPRLPGHGTDVQDMRRTRYSDWRAEVVRTVDRLSQRAPHVVLVGLSMGGSLVLDVASSGERPIAGVVTINAQVLQRDGIGAKLGPYLEAILPIAPAALAGLRKDDIAKPGVSENAYGKVPTAAGNSFVRELPRIREQLPRLGCPLLVAYSPQDHSVPPANSKAILELAAHVHPIELVLERSYHVATLDYDLELLIEHITRFADRLAR